MPRVFIPAQLRDLTGGRYQALVGDVSGRPPGEGAGRVAAGFDDIRQQLLAGGHGSFASIITFLFASSSSQFNLIFSFSRASSALFIISWFTLAHRGLGWAGG